MRNNNNRKSKSINHSRVLHLSLSYKLNVKSWTTSTAIAFTHTHTPPPPHATSFSYYEFVWLKRRVRVESEQNTANSRRLARNRSVNSSAITIQYGSKIHAPLFSCSIRNQNHNGFYDNGIWRSETTVCVVWTPYTMGYCRCCHWIASLSDSVARAVAAAFVHYFQTIKKWEIQLLFNHRFCFHLFHVLFSQFN